MFGRLSPRAHPPKHECGGCDQKYREQSAQRTGARRRGEHRGQICEDDAGSAKQGGDPNIEPVPARVLIKTENRVRHDCDECRTLRYLLVHMKEKDEQRNCIMPPPTPNSPPRTPIAAPIINSNTISEEFIQQAQLLER
jgi:hypothetical protein